MPLNLPDKLPAIDILKEENIFVIDNSRASTYRTYEGVLSRFRMYAE